MYKNLFIPFSYFFRVDTNTPDFKLYNHPKFIVFYDMLLKIFNCQAENPKVSMRQNGTMVTVRQQCAKCTRGYVWNSQTYMPHGKYPTGNMLLSLAVLMAGASISKILLVFRHMGWPATHHLPSWRTSGHYFSQLWSTTGSHTEMASSVSWKQWVMLSGLEMGGSTQWRMQPSTECTQCYVQP